MIYIKEGEGKQSLFEMISLIISSAKGLENIDLHRNQFSPSMTTCVLTALSNSASLETFKKVDLDESANF